MDAEVLDARLRRAFDATPAERRVVSRQATDLHDSGRYLRTHGVELDVGTVVEHLREAPADSGLIERWNWWVGAMELAHGGYERFLVRRFEDGSAVE